MTEWAAVSYLLPAAISWIARPSFECVCRFESDQKVFSILERQLDRCGPENLSRPCECYGYQAFFLGIFLGGCLSFGLRSLWIRAAQGWSLTLPLRRAVREEAPRVLNTELVVAGVVTPSARRKQ